MSTFNATIELSKTLFDCFHPALLYTVAYTYSYGITKKSSNFGTEKARLGNQISNTGLVHAHKLTRI